MPDAVEVQMAQAIATEMNDLARTWAGQLKAAQGWMPVYGEGGLVGLQVSIVALTNDEKKLSRLPIEEMDYGLAIDMQAAVNPDDVASVNLFTKLAQDVHDFYRDGHALAGMTPEMKVM